MPCLKGLSRCKAAGSSQTSVRLYRIFIFFTPLQRIGNYIYISLELTLKLSIVCPQSALAVILGSLEQNAINLLISIN